MQVLTIKLRIFHKALILALIALVPQIFVLIALCAYTKNETDSLDSVSREAFAAISINQIASAVFLAGGFHFLWLSTEKKEDKEKSLQFKEIAEAELSRLKIFAKDYPVKKSIWDKFTSQVDTHFQEAFSISEVSFGNDARARLKKLRHLSFDAYQRFFQYQRAASFQLEDLEQAINRSMVSSQAILVIAMCTLVCHFMLALLAMYLFNKKIIERLRLLVQNAAQLPKRQALIDTVGGNDEISELNDVLKLVSEKLQKAQEHNKSLLSIVAHDMCSPLASMNLSLAMVENSEGQSMSLRDAASISEASEQIDLLVVRARDILNIEKLTQSGEYPTDDKITAAASSGVKELSRLTRIDLNSPDLSEKEAAERFKPGVMKLGLTLFSLPIIVASILFFFIAYSSLAQQKALKEELQQTSIAVDVNRMIACGMGAYGFLTNYLLYGRREDIDKALLLRRDEMDASAKANDLLQSHQAVTAAFLQNFNVLQKLRRLEQKDFESATAGKLAFDDAPGLPLIMKGRHLMRMAIIKQECLWNLSCEQTRVLSKLMTAERDLRKNLETTLGIGIFLCMFLSLVSVFLFSWSVGSRLKLVRSNARKLPERQPLSKPLSGSDEIWYLDFVVHKADELLDLSFRQRTALMNAVAEDLKQPLNQVRQSLSKVDNRTVHGFSQTAKRHFDLTLDNTRRILSLIDTLLSAQSLEAGKIDIKRAVFDVHDAAEDTIDTLAALAASRSVSILNRCDRLEINADRGRITQVLINFVTNAINHSPPSSTVSICTKIKPQWITIEVIDQGPGLPADMLTKVFERYFQTADSKTKNKGYGLGLAICKMIAESHSGSVGVKNEPEGGCCFFLTIPSM